MRLRLLISGVVLPLLLWAALPIVSAGAPTAHSAATLQKKIDATRGKIGARKSKERVLTSDIAVYSRRIARLQSRIGTLQGRQDRVQAELDVKVAELDRTQAQLRAERARLTRLRVRLRAARVTLAHRLRELYEADKPDLVTVVLDSRGFADLLERSDFMRRIGQQDKRIVDGVRAAQTDARATSTRLAALERGQSRIAAAIQARRDEVARLKRGLLTTRDGYDETKAQKRARLMSVKGEREQLEGSLSSLKAQQAKITAALARSAGALPPGAIKRGSGSMIWPVNGPITSPFCERRAWESCHPGIDIGVPAGTPIRAAAGGRVALLQGEAASGGYGNFTCVQHTRSLATCYAHQSRFATSMGASVTQGQIIGYSGCTGRCFGDHLHFEVRVNGSVVNPLNYL
ncbi:MAG: peptidoglycan DD-metalloendopeptidase family protein [Solirubrobacterales bacterium]|nr:peptidoglycan DD-metalloendopeptidase family protein [Solirubrobacterales bacterium]